MTLDCVQTESRVISIFIFYFNYFNLILNSERAQPFFVWAAYSSSANTLRFCQRPAKKYRILGTA